MASNGRNEGSKRHIACQKCRQRKVKCDGRQPYCKRCASGGAAWDCVYGAPVPRSGKTSQPVDVQEAGSSEHAAGQGVGDSKQENENAWVIERASLSCNINFDVLSNPTGLNGSPVDGQDIQRQRRSIVTSSGSGSVTLDSSPKMAIPENVNLDNSTHDDLLEFSADMECTQSLNIASATSAPDINLSSDVMETLLFKYIKSCQSQYLVFQDPTRLSILILESSNECMALRYAICALTISASPELSVWDTSHANFSEPLANQGTLLYEASKRALARHETDQQSHSPSLRVLQITILLGLYELRCAEFSQAWNSVSRAIWIAQSLKLHLLDVHRPFSQFTDEDIDDARIAFWATTGLAGFFSLSGRMVGTMGTSEIALRVPLSNPSFHASGIPGSSQLTMADIFSRTATRKLTVQEAMCVCGVIFPRMIAHVRTVDVTEDAISQPYNFWTNHHRLQGTIGYITSLANNASEDEPALGMLLDAFSIILHEASRRKKQDSAVQTLGSQVWSAENRAVQHALHIGKVVQTQPLSEDCWAAIIGTWAIYVALRSLLQHQQRVASGDDCSNAYIQLCSSDLAARRNDDTSTSSAVTSPTVRSGCFELFDGAPGLLADAVMLDSITALRATLVERRGSTPLATFFLVQVDAEMSLLSDRLYDNVLGVVDFTAPLPFI
ncbi:hypothetical protein GGR58DRAFT_487009 [Xylaria digitata]|nr:hypothetical protein GGR58DRAFT_487009 [Xylaria digitata]